MAQVLQLCLSVYTQRVGYLCHPMATGTGISTNCLLVPWIRPAHQRGAVQGYQTQTKCICVSTCGPAPQDGSRGIACQQSWLLLLADSGSCGKGGCGRCLGGPSYCSSCSAASARIEDFRTVNPIRCNYHEHLCIFVLRAVPTPMCLTQSVISCRVHPRSSLLMFPRGRDGSKIVGDARPGHGGEKAQAASLAGSTAAHLSSVTSNWQHFY